MSTGWVRSLHCKSNVSDDVIIPPPPKLLLSKKLLLPRSCTHSQALKDSIFSFHKTKPSKPKTEPKPRTKAMPIPPSPPPPLLSATLPSLVELSPDHPTNGVVKRIFLSSWSPNRDGSPFEGEIKIVFRIRHPIKALAQFEQYRASVRDRSPGSDPRCIADGNEMMCFHCPAGGEVKYGLSGYNGSELPVKGIRIFSGSGSAHESVVKDMGKCAMLICRVDFRMERLQGDSRRLGRNHWEVQRSQVQEQQAKTATDVRDYLDAKRKLRVDFNEAVRAGSEIRQLLNQKHALKEKVAAGEDVKVHSMGINGDSNKPTYKDKLLGVQTQHQSTSQQDEWQQVKRRTKAQINKPLHPSLQKLKDENKCFRCLQLGHKRANCINAIKCLHCGRFGHGTAKCKQLLYKKSCSKANIPQSYHRYIVKKGVQKATNDQTVPPVSSGVQLVDQASTSTTMNTVDFTFVGERPVSADVFVQGRAELEEENEHLSRTGLVIILRGGTYPGLSQVIAAKLAEEHDREPADFKVAEAAITPFLVIASSEWMRDCLVQRGIYTLRGPLVQFKVVPWRPHFDMVPDVPTHQVWLKLRGAPLQSWTTKGIIDMLIGVGHTLAIKPFGLHSMNFQDITVLVSSGHPSNIPHYLRYKEEGYVTPVQVFINRWREIGDTPFEPFDDDRAFQSQSFPWDHQRHYRSPTSSISRPDSSRRSSRQHEQRNRSASFLQAAGRVLNNMVAGCVPTMVWRKKEEVAQLTTQLVPQKTTTTVLQEAAHQPKGQLAMQVTVVANKTEVSKELSVAFTPMGLLFEKGCLVAFKVADFLSKNTQPFAWLTVLQLPKTYVEAPTQVVYIVRGTNFLELGSIQTTQSANDLEGGADSFEIQMEEPSQQLGWEIIPWKKHSADAAQIQEMDNHLVIGPHEQSTENSKMQAQIPLQVLHHSEMGRQEIMQAELSGSVPTETSSRMKKREKKLQAPTRRSPRIQAKFDAAKSMEVKTGRRRVPRAGTLKFNLDDQETCLQKDQVLEILQMSGVEIDASIMQMIDDAIKANQQGVVQDEVPDPQTPLVDSVPPRWCEAINDWL